MGTRTVLPSGADKESYVREMFDRIAPRYGLMNTVLTGGLDRLWRRAAVRALGLPAGSSVLDLACGPGEMRVSLETAGHRYVGIDLSAGMLLAGRGGRAVPAGRGEMVMQGDAARAPIRHGSVDGITCSFALRNFVDLRRVLGEVARVLRSGGRMAIVEVSAPELLVLRAVHRVYFNRVVPWVGAVLSDGVAYRYLPESVAYLPAPDDLARMIEASGLSSVERRVLGLGAVQLVTATKSGSLP